MRRSVLSSVVLALMVGLAQPDAASAHGPSAARATAPAPVAKPALRRDGLTAIGAAAFDASRSAIEIPFTGRTPRPLLYRLSATHYYYEFEGARFAPGGAQYRKLSSNLERFTLSARPNRPVVRLSFRLTQATVPRVEVDAATGTIRVLPLGRAASLGSVPASVPHGLSLPIERVTDRLTALR